MIPVIRPLLGEEEAAAAAEAIASGWVAQGPRVAEFETAFAAWMNASPDASEYTLAADVASVNAVCASAGVPNAIPVAG